MARAAPTLAAARAQRAREGDLFSQADRDARARPRFGQARHLVLDARQAALERGRVAQRTRQGDQGKEAAARQRRAANRGCGVAHEAQDCEAAGHADRRRRGACRGEGDRPGEAAHIGDGSARHRRGRAAHGFVQMDCHLSSWGTKEK
eukprot:3115833-Pleurochrysis_carterae.AAC.1